MQSLPILKRIVPKPMIPLAHRVHRRYVFERALAVFRANPCAGSVDSGLLQRLRYGWGNEGWSAEPSFLMAALQLALTPNQRILECGSGLSTLLMGTAAKRSGSEVVALEHAPGWAEAVERALDRHLGRHSVSVLLRPLKDYGDYAWYEVTEQDVGSAPFTAVVCDGPPNQTPGGRYGLLPVMQRWLRPGCEIILDDLERPQEQEIVRRWSSTFGVKHHIEPGPSAFARLHMPH